MKLMMTRLLVLAVALAHVCCTAGVENTTTRGEKTLTRGLLRSDMDVSVLYVDKKLAPECKSRQVVDTELVKRFANGTWLERWTVNRCGELIELDCKFFPVLDSAICDVMDGVVRVDVSVKGRSYYRLTICPRKPTKKEIQALRSAGLPWVTE